MVTPRVLVSACLLGQAVRYNGGDKLCAHPVLQRWLAAGQVLPLCPEVAGGLPVPRPPAEIAGGAGGAQVLAGSARVIDVHGRDVSAAFVAGAGHALQQALAHGIRVAVLKEGSPSCGSSFSHDGSFSGTRVPLPGVTTAQMRAAGVQVFSELELDAADAALQAAPQAAR